MFCKKNLVESGNLFFVFPTHNRHSAVLELLFQKFIHGEGNRLAGRHAHDSRCDSFVEGVESFLSISLLAKIMPSHPTAILIALDSLKFLTLFLI